MGQLNNIFRYPVKGLSGDALETVELEPGKPISGDRLYAIALAGTEFSSKKPAFLRKIHFLMLMRDEQLAALNCTFCEDGHRLMISRDGEQLFDESLKNRSGAEAIAAFFERFMEGKLKGRPRLVTADGHMFADVPEQNLSLINLDSVQDIEEKTGLKIDPKRFRGNLLVEGIGAWKEFDLVGQDLKIGDVTFAVSKRIDRCAATNVNLETAERDMNLPLAIRKVFGHIDCGVYVDVTVGGQLNIGDKIQVP
tara:strand:- start:573 stop:1328 length:756 start_codon:yes stop_codon:yes gene_type:complete